jgi:CHAT domain-containing protein
MTEVEGLDLNADLIILSGCNTGGADGKTAGESLSGLARAFFYAGARSVLATHWSVNDQVGAYLIAETLRRLRDEPGRNIAEVLRETEIAMIDGAGNRLFAGAAHPFYWAPYVVIGDGGAGGSSQRTVASLQSAAHP